MAPEHPNDINQTLAAGDDASYPKWIDDDHLDLSWIRSRLEPSPFLEPDTKVVSCSAVKDKSNETRRGVRVRDGATLAFTVTLHVPSIKTIKTNDDDDHDKFAPPTTRTLALMMKQVPASGLSMSLALGLAREAFFYQDAAKILTQQHDDVDHGAQVFQESMPIIYYAAGDAATGDKVIIMDDLSACAVDSAVYFAASSQQQHAGWKGNPNLWQRQHAIMTAIQSSGGAVSDIPSQAMVARVTFESMARIHAYYWRRADLLLLTPGDKDWLRGQAWLQGQDRSSWEASQNMIQQIYQTKMQDASFDTCLAWDPVLLEATHKAMQNISWEAHQRRLNTDTNWTLVHGDFWPGNVLWMLNDANGNVGTTSSVRLIDWEMCGVGSGPQDLGQYVISNMEPGERRACERDLVKAYHDELIKAGVVDVTFEYCWNEYRLGGVERWMWFLVYFVGLDGFVDWAQFFHDQMAAFMNDHNLTAADISQPRP